MQTTVNQSSSPLTRYLAMFALYLLVMLIAPTALAEKKAEFTGQSTESDTPTETTEQQQAEPATDKDVQNPSTEQTDANSDSQPPASEPEPNAESQIEDSMANIEVIQQTLESLRNEIENSKETTSLTRDNVQTIRDGISLIDEKIKQAYTGLDESRTGVAANTKSITNLTEGLLSATRDIKANAADLSSQKSLIEDNSIRLYEILIQISSMNDEVDQFSKALDSVRNSDQKQELKLVIGSDLNRLWIMLSIILVFFSPVAFVLSSNRDNYRPLMDGTQQHQGILLVCLGVFLGYFAVGFGLMYGESSSGLIGTTNYLLEPINTNRQPVTPFNEFVLYQSGFAMLAAMIVYIAVGRQLSSVAHLVLALFVGVVLIPIFGHWSWSSYFIPTNKGWLEGAGFVDQAGAVTINTVAAWFAFTIVWKLGKSSPPPQQADKEFDDPVYSASATLLLWISWIGFTTGTLPISSEQIPGVVLNIGLAGSAGGITAFMHYVFFHTDKSQIARALGGFVSGLVAIAACAQSVTFIEALTIGAIAGLLQNLAYSLLRKIVLKQSWQVRPAYLVAIHGVAGIWGALSFALFGSENTFGAPDFTQLVTQAQGIATALAYSIVTGHVAMLLLAFRKKQPQTA